MCGKVVALNLLALLVAPAQAQTLDYGYFKAQVEPIFLQKRAGHARCYVCHAERSNNSFRLEKLSAGANGWEAPGDLHSSGARRSRCVLGRTEEAARPSSTSVVESSRRTPVEFEKTIAVIFLPG